MSQSIQLQVTQVGLEQSIAAAMKRVGSSSQINLGTSSKQINALSQPLGRITGQADEFSKSMAAANARVLAFGASAGIIAGVSSAMSGLLSSTIKVEKSLVEISTVLNKTGSELDEFGQDIFNVAKNTGKSFDEVAKGALELARQGLNAEDTLARLNDALILSRLSGLDAAQSVEGLTAAFNSFKSSGITTAEILNKVVAAAQKYSVSEKDIIEGLKRSASVANLAGVSFEELAAVITAVQEKTARGGAVIGNAFKTIFSRIQDKAVLSDLQDMRVGVTDLQGDVLPALKILENLAKKMEGFSQIEQADIAKKLGGVYQLDKLLAALSDLSDKASVTTGALKEMGEAGDSAYKKNAILNETLAALLNKVTVSAEQLGAKLGEIGVTDSLKNVLGFFNSLLEGMQKILGQESGLGDLVRGLVKGLGSFLAGPGLALFGGIILKLSKDLVQFGFASLKAFFGIGKAAKEVQNVEGAISQILSKNVNLQQQLFALEGNRAGQLRLITGALVEQEAVLRRSANISSGLAAPLYNVGARAKNSGLRIGNSAGGYMPAVAKESKAIKQGVGGARSGDRPVVMPNFNFGGGKKGTMVAHTGEYVVPNFNGSGGSAVFNRRMVQSMGLPSGAKKIGAAGGFVPNFVNEADKQRNSKGLGASTILQSIGFQGDESYDEIFKKIQTTYKGSEVKWVNDKKNAFNIFQNGKSLTSQAIPISAVEKQRDSKELKKGESVYDARQQPNSAVMLIPQNSPYNSSGLNVAFTEKRKVGGKIYDRFIGGIAGIQENLSDTDEIKFSKVSKIDESLRKGLSEAAFNILSGIQPGIKLDEPNDFLPKNIEGLLEKGGPGAFGALKGALFEGIINKVAEAKGRNFKDSGSLDIDFQAGGDKSRTILETIFGLKARQYDFADFKNSKKSKASYIDQVINYLPKDKSIVNGAGGYIPNFVSQSRKMGEGIQGSFYKLGSKGGADVGVKKFHQGRGDSPEITKEWLVAEYISKHMNVPAVSGPKNLSTLSDSIRKRSIRKELVSDPLARTALGYDSSTMFGSNVLFNALDAQGLSIGDLHGGNYTVNASAANEINGLRNFPRDRVGAFSLLRKMSAKGSKVNIIDPGLAQVYGSARTTIGDILQRSTQSTTSAAGGFVPNFALNGSLKRAYDLYKKIPSGAIPSIAKTALTTNPLNIAKTGLFAAKAAKTFGVTMLKGGKLDIESIWGHLTNFVQNPENLIKNQKDLMDAKTAIQTILNNDILRDRFAKFAAKRVNTEYYNNKNVIVGTQDTRPSDKTVLDSSMQPVARPIGKGSSMSEPNEEYLKYRLFGGTRDLKDYDGKKPSEYYQKGKFLKFYQNSNEVDEIRGASYEASMIGMSNKHVSTRPRMLDKKGRYYGNSSLMGGFTGRLKKTRQGEFASYRDVWDIALHAQEKKILDDYLNNRTKPSKEILSSTNAYQQIGSSLLDFNIGPYILRELVSSIPKARPVEFRGVTRQGTNEDFYDGYAGGYIPNFANPLRPRVNLSRSPEQLEAQRAMSKKAANYRKASGAIGKLFGAIDKAGPTVLLDGVISGAEIQGLNLDYIKTLIENNGAIAQMFLGDKGSNFVVQAKKYGITVQQSAMKKLTSLAAKGLNKIQGLAGGYLPNFANPLQAAVGREMAAGVPASQIYIDKSPSLKSAANPMGLMVANRRDEPAGGFQGINRAMREGRDPKMYGAAGGFVPNYAAAGAAPSGPDLAPFVGKTVPEATKKIQEDLKTALSNITKQYQAQFEDVKKNSQKIKEQIKLEDAKIQLLEDEIKESKKALAAAKKKGVNPIEVNREERRIKNLENDLSNTQSSRQKITPIDINQERKNLRESALKQRAEERKNTATLTTAVSANAQRGLTNPITPRVVDPKAPKQGMDLGVIFAVQGAMSALTGATAESTNGLAKFTNALSEGIGNFVTAAFAIQGITAMGGAVGAITSKLGPYGLAIAGITAAYSATAKYLDEIKGINKAAAQNIAMMSDAASKAAFNLNNLPQAAQKNIKQSAVGLVSGAATYGGEYINFKGENFKVRTKDVDFEGSDLVSKGELQKSLDSVSESALGAGVSYDFMWNAINKRSEDGKLTIKEVDKLTKEFTKLMVTSYELGDGMRNLDLSPKSTLMKDLAGMSPEAFDKALSDLKPGTPINDETSIGKIQRSIVDALPANKKAAFDPNSEAAKNQVREIRRQALDQEKALKDSAVESEKSYRINTNRMQAEYAFEEKMKADRQAASNLEIKKIEDISKLEQDRTISDDYRAKKIAEINTELSKQISELKTIEEQQKKYQYRSIRFFNWRSWSKPRRFIWRCIKIN